MTTLAEAPKPVQDLFQRMWLEMEADAAKRRIERAKADPLGNKLTTQFEGQSMNWHYAATLRDGRGRRVRFCWSCHRNAAGFFLGWREVWDAKRGTGKRDQWVSRRVRKAVAEIARRRTAAFRAKHA